MNKSLPHISPILTIIFMVFFVAGCTSATVAATFTVTKTADANDGVCDADCSLREAVAAVNAATTSNNVISFDPIVFSSPQTITLTNGNLSFNSLLGTSLVGNGVNFVTIDCGTNFMVMTGSRAHVSISDLTITGNPNGPSNRVSNGSAAFLDLSNVVVMNGPPQGPAVWNLGTLTVQNSIIRDSKQFALYNDTNATMTVVSTLIDNNGGGVVNWRGAVLTMSTTTISNSTNGGGIMNTDGKVSLTSVFISGNRQLTGFHNHGGGIMTFSEATDAAIVNIDKSTISGNVVSGDSSGGGIACLGTSAVTVTNSTISSNRSLDSAAGGIYTGCSHLTISNSTISGNSAFTDGGGLWGAPRLMESVTINNNSSAHGGGVFNSNPSNFYVHNSLIANNLATAAGPDVLGGFVSQGYNLVANTSGLTIAGDNTGNIVGIDPQISALRNNGGPTLTASLQPTSPAIDAGDPNTFLATDQRGISRAQDGDLNDLARPDIGAYERQVTSFTVTKTDDTSDGICDADCSLREAVTAANTASTPDNAILFSPDVFGNSQMITLTGGQLNVNQGGTLWVKGPGANLLTISGNNQHRIFFISSIPAVLMSNLKLTAGSEPFGTGGGILNAITSLTLTNLMITSTTASVGGGIANQGGKLVVQNSTLNNDSAGSMGGAISNESSGQNIGVLTITGSTIANNTADHGGGGIENIFAQLNLAASVVSGNAVLSSSNSGGGIENLSGQVAITGSTLSDNTCTDGGGGVISDGSSSTLTIDTSIIQNNHGANGAGVRGKSATMAISNSTISNNTASFRGGGVLVDGGTLTLDRSTVNNNMAVDAGGGVADFGVTTITNSTIANNSANNQAGGIYNSVVTHLINVTISGNSAHLFGGAYNTGSFTSRNSLIANNTASTAPDFQGSLSSEGYNLIGSISGSTITGVTTGNILGQDPKLLTLQSNGGSTQTLALQPTSPAIDAGDPSNALATDQRGISRPRDGDGNGSARADIGSYELRLVSVTNVNDSGTGSLRQAIATAATQADAIGFSSSPFTAAQTITLTSGELFIPSGANFFLNGQGSNKLTVNGNHQSRVVYVDSGANVTINGVTITGGNGTGAINSGHDGGISNWGKLSVLNSVVRDNSANGNGGGIGNGTNGILTVSNSTIRNNSAATIAGGGIFLYNSTATVMNSTINNNMAAGVGGGIASILGNATIRNSTVSNNIAGNGGGGISNFTASSVLTVTNSTVSGNSTTNNSGGGINNQTGGVVNARSSIFANNFGTSPDFAGPLASQGYNLIKDVTGATINGLTTGNILGQDPQLLSLRDFGGLTQIQPLRLTSPALDKGCGSAGITTDQRGSLRPFEFQQIPNAPGCDGSDIGAFERQATDISGVAIADFDGDGKSDISVWRDSDGNWYFIKSSDNTFGAFHFGSTGDVLVPGDYDGDGKVDVAVFRPSNATWYIQASTTGFSGTQFGLGTDLPAQGDFDGDGKTDIAVFRPSNGTWYLLQSMAGFSATQFGTSGDKPVVGDYDGDGKADIAVYRPSEGNWYQLRSTVGFAGVHFGISTDKVVPADYDGDGKTDLAVYRDGSPGNWFLLESTAGFVPVSFGTTGDTPVPGDFDGDGKADTSVFRPSGGNWYLQRSTSGFAAQQFGVSTDKPVEASYVPVQ